LIIQTLVEGEGEERAVPLLLRRFREVSGAFSVDFGRPIRKHRSELVNESPLRRAVQVALRQERGCDGILILFDADKDCPKDLVVRVQAWARAEAGRTPCEVVIAHREYEAWFLGSLESLRDRRNVRPDAVSHTDPESMRGAKGKLQSSMLRPYSETVDQPALTALFDLAAAHRTCRSFRRMAHAFGLLAAAAGAELGEWPPSTWY
jgi:uncharacterized protein DUF4276